jgi:[protein-PII] uridylyltransferase
VIIKLSDKIQNIPRLRALFFLTVTDISAVDQGLWNNWKSSLLRQLFLKLEHQIKSPKEIISLNEKIQQIRLNILKYSKKISKRTLDRIAKITYPSYWLLQSEKMIIFQIENFLTNMKNEFNFVLRKSDDKSFYELIIFTKDKYHLFLNLISIFVLEGLSVFEARIFTLDDGTAIDTFKFSFDERKNFNQSDIDRIIRSVENKLKYLGNGKTFEIKDCHEKELKLLNITSDVDIDNDSSATYTILNVKTNNRPLLLYDISKILIKNKIIISMAKISTYGDFVEDSFHLRSEYGLKINNTDVINKLVDEIKKKLLFRLNDVI